MPAGPQPFPDHVLSIYQSAVDDLARRTERDAPAEAKGLTSTAMVVAAAEVAAHTIAAGATATTSRTEPGPQLGEHMSVAGGMRACAALGHQYLEARIRGDDVEAQSLKGQLHAAMCDPGWATTIEEYLSYFGPGGARQKPPYRRPADVGRHVLTVKPDARIALVGDWGTGAEPAQRVMQQIAVLAPDILIHLGDVYYSGTPAECRRNFLEPIEKAFAPGRRPPVFTLPGNHDMYSGGQGFYELIDQLNSPDMRQHASFFCLRSADDAWQLIGMDTGLNDTSPFAVMDTVTFLEPDEEQWHLDRISEFSGRTILLSHHQLFSAFLKIGPAGEAGRLTPYNPRLLASFRRFAATGKPIATWFWGHEHNLCIYEPYLGLSRGRCIGHGAIPVFVSAKPYETLVKLEDPPRLIPGPRLEAEGEVYALGFAMLTLEPASKNAEVVYYQDKGGRAGVIHRERLAGDVVAAPVAPDGQFPSLTETEFFAPAIEARGRRRKIAFVVGNGAYSHVPTLRNSAADARALRAELERLGFAVHGGINFDLVTLAQRFAEFEARIAGADVALLYFSGHGVQMGGQNFLLPIDGDLDSLEEPARRFELQECANRMLAKARRCLLFLDACRDNPFVPVLVARAEGAKGIDAGEHRRLVAFASRGLAALDVAPDAEAFIAFAAAPGRAAYGSEGTLSHFTAALIRHLDTQGLDLEGLIKRVGSDVKTATNGAQDPWVQSNLKRDFFFRPLTLAPVWILATLGMISGVLSAFFVYNEKIQLERNYWGGLILSLVVAYGVWRWGRRSLWGAAVALIVANASCALGIAVFDQFGTFKDRADYMPVSFENWRLTRDMLGGIVACGIMAGGCVLGGALTVPSLRRTWVFAVALLSGILSAAIFGLALWLQIALLPFLAEYTSGYVLSRVGLSGWHALIAAAIGYGLAQYIPEASERTPTPAGQRRRDRNRAEYRIRAVPGQT